jgi:hypothetical protein
MLASKMANQLKQKSTKLVKGVKKAIGIPSGGKEDAGKPKARVTLRQLLDIERKKEIAEQAGQSSSRTPAHSPKNSVQMSSASPSHEAPKSTPEIAPSLLLTKNKFTSAQLRRTAV